MFRRLAFLLFCCFVVGLLAPSASADPRFIFLRGSQDPPNLQNKFHSCISQFKAAGGLPNAIVQNQLNGAQVVIYYQKGSSATADPNPGGLSTGKPVHLYWDPNISGFYPDNAAKDPCATLLHELQHASRFFLGKECSGNSDVNQKALDYDEKMASRAENWWLNRKGLDQRQKYEKIILDDWTRWPASPDNPVPPAPRCIRACKASPSLVASTNSADQALAACRCTRFHQPGCIDFHGGIYSGGDHRRVANGSLKIIVGDTAYCQRRRPCQFLHCVTCPHLDTAFPQGVTVTAIAIPGKDSYFARWGPGECKGQGQTCSFEATKPSCISAQFLLTNPTAPPQSLPTIACREDP